MRPYLVRQRELETLVVSGIDELERSRDRLEDGVGHIQAVLEQLGGRVNGLGDRVDRLDRLKGELEASPYVAETEGRGEGSAYASFEDVFRGPEERVRRLVEPYVGLLRGHEPVLDVGCGRGELLQLLAEEGIEARGIDVDPGMVERTRARGLAVEQADAVSYLE